MPAGYSNMGDNQLRRAVIKDASWTVKAHGTLTSGATTTVDVEDGNIHTMTIGGAGVQTLTLSNASASGTLTELTLIITNGTSAAITFAGGTFTHAGGSQYTETNSGTDIVYCRTTDGGSNWTVHAEVNFS